MPSDEPQPTCRVCGKPIREGDARYRTATGDVHVRCHEGPRVLVVEDEAAIRDMIVDVVRRAGYAADAVANGREAIERIPAHHYDMILCDLRMPVMGGPELYHEIQRRYPDVARRLVFMTAHANIEEYVEFVREVRAPVLKKPFYIEELRDTLARMIGPQRR
jgi:CheY-like chemotaxis protein